MRDNSTPNPTPDQTALGGSPAVAGSGSSPEPLHVYEWLDQPAKDDNERLAKEWLEQFVKPASEKDYAWLNARVLTCEYRGNRYRCIGASRMGDVWLTSKMSDENGYEKRVNVEELSKWQRVDSSEDEPKPRRSKSGLMGLLAMSAMMAGSFGMGYGGRSSYAERHDPDRPKTPEDLERMEAAQRKRDRKAARKGSQNDQGEAQPPAKNL